ncbi:hypothetical protein BJ170DRAFT_250660 [Xylariales sp. AK1849]|nr:hypothetical protein BJ170DRAFT_250660 [Xylariales sp. AK1849]
MSSWGKAQGFFLSDEEMGKKDDDHKPSVRNGGLRAPNWQHARGPQRRSLKRIAVVLLVAALVYLFVHNIPTDLGPRRTGRPQYGARNSFPASESTSQLETYSDNTAQPQERTYNGPPKFLKLAASLHQISGTRGSLSENNNILFAASSLKSAAVLLPIACQMGRELRTYVHFALMSRSDISMEELQRLNGVDKSCEIIFHDARSENARIMTDDRIEYSVFRAFHHIYAYMHPQAIVVDSSEREEWFFSKSARSHTIVTGNTLIELPHSSRSLSWMTKLDSQSLHAWDKNRIDILIQAVPGTSGSLIRLLRSLSAADYTSSTIPHLTIELPHDIDPATKLLLENFQWPPAHIPNPTGAKYVSLRHRIPRQRLTEEESSARFLESFWPANPGMSHILVLSPQMELAPNFYHYLRYTLLEYRYSITSRLQHWDARLFGISLEQPLVQLDGGEKFTPPLRLDGETDRDVPSSFLWQAPTSNAMLFLGEKWIELHDFVSRSLEAQQNSGSVASVLSKKVVSTRHPSWLEHALRLSRLRGYWTLYPGEKTARSLGTVHTELYHIPEEYSQVEEAKVSEELGDKATEEEIQRVVEKLNAGSESNRDLVPSLQGLFDDGALRTFNSLPLVTWDGKKTYLEELDVLAAEYAIEFKKRVGNCVNDDLMKNRTELSTEDLFCTTN